MGQPLAAGLMVSGALVMIVKRDTEFVALFVLLIVPQLVAQLQSIDDKVNRTSCNNRCYEPKAPLH